MRSMRLGAILAVALVSAASAQPTGRDTAVAVTMVNQHRAAHGLPPVKSDPTLLKAAAYQTGAMVQRSVMSHSAGGEFGQRIRSFGIRGVAAENIGYGYQDIAHAMAGWKASAGHNVNLLNPYVARIGVHGALGADGRPYWTMILAQ